MKILVTLLCMGLITSCITSKKAYNYVATDPAVDGRELSIMSQKCAWLFPTKISPPVLSGQGIDSIAYNESIENQRILLGHIMAAQKVIDSLTGRKPCAISPGDSAGIIDRFLKTFKPKPIIIRDTVETEKESTATLATISSLRGELLALRAENHALSEAKASADQKVKDKNSKQGWFWAGALLAAIIAFFAGRIIKR